MEPRASVPVLILTSGEKTKPLNLKTPCYKKELDTVQGWANLP
ncbi:conserved hypothetical protein [Treponema phagedenis]|uniref:Uncharacterized protein n=1 Tax=Treponema phagedenis TaxID=162 RepID=A0A0B7GY40_TREPH|nr:conserved hypothetical protein [Treponema phagedenis]